MRRSRQVRFIDLWRRASVYSQMYEERVAGQLSRIYHRGAAYERAHACQTDRSPLTDGVEYFSTRFSMKLRALYFARLLAHFAHFIAQSCCASRGSRSCQPRIDFRTRIDGSRRHGLPTPRRARRLAE